MSYCGGGRGATPPQMGRVQPTVSPLANVRPDEKVWVQYNGKRQASFGIKGNFTGTVYRIDGPGHKLEVHVHDLDRFKRLGRGSDFAVSVAAPSLATTNNGAGQPTPIPTPTIQDSIFKADKPELARIERLDKKAAERG